MGGGEITLHPPVKDLKDGWVVVATDDEGGRERKKFLSEKLAHAWFEGAVSGKVIKDIKFGPGKLNDGRTAAVAASNMVLTGSESRMSNATQNKAGINLRSVAEVLDAHGLNPFEEVAKIMAKTRPVMDRNGDPVIDPDTLMPMHEHVLDDQTRARVALELGQYIKPKLKSIEMKVEDSRQMSEDEVEAKIARLMAKAAARRDGSK